MARGHARGRPAALPSCRRGETPTAAPHEPVEVRRRDVGVASAPAKRVGANGSRRRTEELARGCAGRCTSARRRAAPSRARRAAKIAGNRTGATCAEHGAHAAAIKTAGSRAPRLSLRKRAFRVAALWRPPANRISDENNRVGRASLGRGNGASLSQAASSPARGRLRDHRLTAADAPTSQSLTSCAPERAADDRAAVQLA